jgi:hypothetical protein
MQLNSVSERSQPNVCHGTDSEKDRLLNALQDLLFKINGSDKN